MEHTVFIDLLLVAVIGIITPLLTHLVPRNLFPEAVALVLFGMLIGPEGLGWAHISEPIAVLKELGMGFLFLLAGYEVNVRDLKGYRGIQAVGSWVISFTLALGVVWILGWAQPLSTKGITFAIALTATALGTLLPIIKERGLLSGNIGSAVLAHGTIGEMFPIVLMAFFLSGRGYGLSTVIMGVFIAVTVLIAAIPIHVRKFGSRIADAVHLGSHTTAQMTVRLVFAVLAGLMALAVVLKLDVVLGAFAAGVIVRQAVPNGREELEIKLDGIAYGIFIPMFFVITGMGIDLSAMVEKPLLIVSVLLLLIVIRGLPIFLITVTHMRAVSSAKGTFARLGESAQIALYCTTSLPIIVAVTQLAQTQGIMTSQGASTLVLAGVLSVLVMPALCVLIPLKYTTISKEDAGDTEEWLPWIEHSWHSDR